MSSIDTSKKVSSPSKGERKATLPVKSVSKTPAKPNPHLTPIKNARSKDETNSPNAGNSLRKSPLRATPSGKDSKPASPSKSKSSSTPKSKKEKKSVTSEGYTDDVEVTFDSKALTSDLLKEMTGWDDLNLVLSTTLRVDAEELIGLDRLPEFLPSLNSLRLSHSRIPKIRSLGTKLNSLKILWLNNSKVENILGLGVFAPNLTELYLAFNRLKDITPIMDICDTLEVLDLEGNEISSLEQANHALRSLKKLKSLTLQGNPITRDVQIRQFVPGAAEKEGEEAANRAPVQKGRLGYRPSLEIANLYREWVATVLPSVEYLDDFPINEEIVESTDASRPTTRVSSANSGHNVYFDPTDDALADELRLVQESIRELGYDKLDKTVDDTNKVVYERPSTSSRGGKPSKRLGGEKAAAGSDSRGPRTTESSALTTGNAFAGSAIASLRKRGGVTPPQPSLTSAEQRRVQAEQPENVEADVQPRERSGETEDADADLFYADDAEEEYEKFKTELIKKRFAEKDPQSSAGSNRPMTAKTAEYLDRMPEQEAASFVSSGAPISKSEMMKEVGRTKAQIARGGTTATTADTGFSNSNNQSSSSNRVNTQGPQESKADVLEIDEA